MKIEGKTNPQNSKFKLDGTIHGKSISSYIEEQIEISKRRPRILIVILFLAAAAALLWGAISQYKLLSQQDNIATLSHYKEALTKTENSLQATYAMRDSLENIIYSLRTENEILSENSEPPIGIFFEVQIGSFTDFNLDQYNKNLANIKQEKYNRNSKFLLGRFRSFKKAIVFESDLKRMGINKAFIVGRIDDQIVTYKEALEALEASKN